MVRVIADQLERCGDNDLQHLRLGEPGGQEGVQFRLLDPAPLFDDGDGEIAQNRQTFTVDGAAVADGVNDFLINAGRGR